MEISINPSSPRWPSLYPSYQYKRAPSQSATDAYEMSDVTSLKPAHTQSDAASAKSGTTPLLGSSNAWDAPSITSTKRKRNWRKGKRLHFHGWRVGVILCSSTAATVLFVNIVLTIWACAKNGVSGGLATIQDGSCKQTKDLSLWLHLTINVLSTALLAASNYCMQCLSSPTREEVDRAHSRHIWLDIGVPSVRNLRNIAWNRIILWWLLAFSGVPLHLLYNSAVFSTLASQEYTAYVAAPELISGAGVNMSKPLNTSTLVGGTPSQFYQNTSNWQILSNSACMRAYGQEFVSAYSDVLLISPQLNASDPLEIVSDSDRDTQPYNWMCREYSSLYANGDSCDIGGLYKYASSWSVSGYSYRPESYTVDHCMGKVVEERCRLQLSLVIMGIVMFCNLMKATCMYLVLRQQKSPPLVTLGDAIESFLQQKDPTTENMCLSDKYKFSKKDWGESAIPYARKSYPWFSSASPKRWLTCNVLCTLTLIIAGVLLKVGLKNYLLPSRSISYLWGLGFGAVTSQSMISWNKPGGGGLLLTVLVANSPQALLSFLFLTYNGLYTCMLMANEWSDYAYDRKPLRVTNPIGNQRSTYRLQLPYKYGIPLTILSGTLHWLVSQSLFLARVASFDSTGEEDTLASVSTVGYSCIAIITVIILGAIVIALGIGNGFRRFRPGMPLVGSCSAAISAACHQPIEDTDAAILPVLWGAVSGQAEGAVGHCCFSTLEVSPPIEGEVYAGRPQESNHRPLVPTITNARDQRIIDLQHEHLDYSDKEVRSVRYRGLNGDADLDQ